MGYDMNWLDSAIQHCVTKTTLNSRKFKDFPHITEGGKYQFTLDGVWTGGFWTGLLWLCYEEQRDPELLTAAKGFTERLLPRANDSRNHDLGFMFYPSAIAGWRLTGEESYHAAALNAAESLARQFNEAGGFIPGWGFFGGEEWAGAVLIDTLMNLPLLVWASDNDGGGRLLRVVDTHTAKALDNHLRADGSVFHVYHFSPQGEPLRGDTYQGLAPGSAWSRGQGWAIAGLSMLAGARGNKRYREAAQQVAQFIMANLPADRIPLWDYRDGAASAPKDASAGAISAFGLLRLFKITQKAEYLSCAEEMLKALSESCLSDENEGLLSHATADLPHGLGIDESTIYGDYYFLKALLELKKTAD